MSFSGLSQETIVNGKVTDAETGEPLPFANIYFKETNIGTATDFDGFYTIKTSTPKDSVTCSFFGYTSRTKAIVKGVTQTIDFQLSPEVSSFEEIVITGRENPAFPVMRNVIKNKDKNDKRKLSAYEYESFNKIEISLDNVSEKFQDKKVMQQIAKMLDSVKARAGEDGKPVLPVFVSEALSNYYHRANPDKTKEVIIATKISGIGITDGSLTSQLIGSSFQEYNFYRNWLNILEKDFVSPIADEWQGFYEYVLDDSMFIGDKWCYKIDFKPRREQDLAFTGTIWINDTTFALKQIEATIDKKANLNYIEKIKIQQELDPSSEGAWLPVKTRVLIDIAELKSNSTGLLAKFYTSNRYFNINHPRPPEFYDELLVVEEDATMKSKEFWDERRHDSMTTADKYVYSMIDSIKNVPLVKTYVEILNVAVNGYKKVGKIDIGPYLFLYANNNIEGHRIRLGFKTNIDFSNRWIFKAYAAYGTLDERWKYGAEANYILSRHNWTVIGVERREDIDQLGLAWDILNSGNNNIFLAFSRWGTLRGPYYSTQNMVRFERKFSKDFSQKIILKNRTFDPLYPFAYYNDLKRQDSTLQTGFTTSEIILESRYAKDEFFLQNDNDRISMGTKRWPIFTLRYTMGLKGALGSQFNYHKLNLDISDIFRWGTFGRTYFNFSAGRIFSPVPYPLLEVHIGNESPFYTTAAFNLMNYFEFISDNYAALKYRHYFEGLFFNRIPLIKKLKWRLLTTGGIVYGGISRKNQEMIPSVDANGQNIRIFSSLEQKPYVELGYGIENIFKVLRVDAFHRITYRDRPGVNTFGVKVSFQFIL
ncbi:MAG: DUF5686 and carboxypeptidase regulatory-like domain-containing protein [Cytophagaceae bacterium]|nr:DUF5686 and carboxypeptidase regulatory-like domain-containing protein [Cytophagaceae bacterium]